MAAARRESNQEFWARMEREGRRAQAETARDQTLAEGNSKRQTQSQLVAQFQPLDGTKTRAWPTPNSWERGREARKRPDEQEQLERDVMWVLKNRDQPPDKARTPGARFLLETAQKDADAFLKVYLKCVPSIAKREYEREEARRQRLKDRKEAACKRAAADKRAYYRNLERLREQGMQ
jgi:hypothetical protein